MELPLRRTIIGLVVLAALALPGLAHATGGPAYKAAVTATGPTIDGTIGATEWQDAPVYSLSFGNIPATVRFVHTSTALYIGVVVQDVAPGATPSLSAYFDNNHDGIKNAGDDVWLDAVGSAGQDFFYSPTGTGGASHYNDSIDGGSDDTNASGTITAAGVTFEIEHPLCTTPNSTDDMCVQPDATLGLDFQYEPTTGFFDAPGPNTFDPSLTWADLTLTSGDVAPPTVTLTAPVAGTALQGTAVTVAADASDNVGVASVDFQYFDGATFREIATDTTSPYSATFDSTSVADTPVGSATIYATATDAAGNRTTVGNGIGVSNGSGGSASGGSLSGSSVTGATLTNPTSVDLTVQGSEDWAIWGFASNGTSTSLAPDVRKANGSGIGDLTNIDPGTTVPLRGIGQFPEPFTFSWSDGTGDTPTASVAQGGIQHDGEQLKLPTLGKGFSFDVPADRNSRTVRVYVSTNRAAGQLTATLSDGSAAAFTSTLPAAENAAFAIYTIRYAAASAEQTLHVQWVETENDCTTEFSCDNAALYAVALSGAGAATGTTASLSTGRSVGISGSNDPIADLPLRAFEPAPNGTTPAPINGLPINGLPINGLPINGLPINGLPINGLPINGLPINGLPINGLPINGLPINGLPINGLPINGLPLTTPGGWAALLKGTALDGLPLQTITLQQVLALSPAPDIKLGQLDLSGSTLGQMTIGALALGSTPINGLGLPADALASLVAWCKSAVTSDPDTSCTAATIGVQSLFALGLAGAPINGLPINGLPINGLPINGLPINGLPINGLDLSASPINGLPINGLAPGATPINGLSLADIVNHSPAFGAIKIADLANQANLACTLLDCTTGTLADAAAASAISASATLADVGAAALGSLTLGDLHYYDDLTIGDLEQSLVGTNATLGDLIGLLVNRADVPWETLSPRLLSFFDPHRRQLSLAAHFTFAGTGAVAGQAQVTLPEGFDVVPGSSTLGSGELSSSVLPDPVVDGRTATWDLPSVSTGTAYTLEFTAYSGTDVGPAQATMTVTSGAASATASSSFDVTDTFEPNDDGSAAELPTITPDEAVQQGAISTRGDVDFYRVPLPPAGTRLNVHLTNLPADYDLALYASRTTAVRTGATSGTPLQDGTVPDQPINTEGGANAQLTPTALQDVPDPGIPVVQVSPNRGTDDEDVGMVSPGGDGDAVIAVFGYNGASSPKAYSLRVTTKAPTVLTCPARTFPGGGTPGTVPALASLPSDLNTLVLVNEKRIGDTYGATAEANVAAALTRFAGDRSLGVSGAVIPVEGLAQSQYDAWDANPCDVSAANDIANTIADEIAAAKVARPSLRYVVFAGGDDQIPFFRVPDLSRIANENGFASSFEPNEYYGALASSDLLSDNPYLDTRPVPAGGRQLFIPDLVGGRLVEKPDQIVSAIAKYESSHGTLARSTAFVSGYDFVSDGSALVQSRLDSFLGTPTQTLIDNTWSKSDLFDHAFPTGGPAAINDWNGHFDNHQALAANGDRSNLIETTDLTGAHALSGGIFFTMGCHAGFQTTDAIVGGTSPDALDWSEYFAGTGTSFVGNTGYGLGNTDSVAFSEELMADFAGNLGGSLSIGEALTRAKQDYYLGRTAFSSYDEKTLSEAELYGLPMYGVGTAPAAVGASAPSSTPAPDPVRGASSSTSPTAGSLTLLPSTTASVASFDVTPAFGTVQTGAHGQYLANAGQVQAPNYRPLQPFVTLPATRTGQVAHGVLIDGLTSQDVSPFDPDNVRPTLDLTASEPEPQFTDEAWPTKVPTLVTLDGANGRQQSLNLATGQFFTDDATHTGVERKWTHISGRVTYSASTDVVPPTIDSIDAFVSNGAVAFTGRFSDLTETGAAGTVALAQVVYDVDNGGTWLALPLHRDASTGEWSGGAAFSGTQVQYFVEACDTAGNCGFSSNKGRYFDAQPLPNTSSSITFTPSRSPDSGAWYTAPLTVTATAGTADISVSVDGGALTPATSPIALDGNGPHVLDARASDGDAATRVFLVDLSDPTTPVFTGIQPGFQLQGDLPAAVGCTSTDAVSGLKSCVVSGYDTTPGTHTATATATDNAGRTSTATLTYIVGFQVGGILPPVTAPSNDQGNPVAADLQAFKIKSTIPVKFKLYLNAAKTLLLKTPPAGSVAKLSFGKYNGATSSTDTTALVSSTADDGNVFRFTGSPDYQYIYNLRTSGQTAGTYYVTLTLSAADGTVLAQSAKQYFILRS